MQWVRHSSVGKTVTWTLLVLAALLTVGVLAGSAILLYAGHSRSLLMRLASQQTRHPVTIRGRFEAHLFSLEPRVTAENVSIGNPSWTPPGEAAHIARLSIRFDWPLFVRTPAIYRLEMQGAVLHLLRDRAGRANWEWTSPDNRDTGDTVLVRSLSVPGARVDLDDARQHLKFAGSADAEESQGSQGPPVLRIRGAGELNGRPVTLSIQSEPLATVQRARPYHFIFTEDSSGSHLEGSGFLPRPFDFDALETDFHAAGGDLNDLYFLTGLSLPHTGSYHLSGHLARNDAVFHLRQLAANSGRSDMSGELTIDSSGGRPHFDADLHSDLFRMSDIGQRTGKGATENEGLFSRTTLPTDALLLSDGKALFHARGLQLGERVLHSFGVTIVLDHGVLNAAPLTATFADGRIEGRIRTDAQQKVPTTELDLRFHELQLGSLWRKPDTPPPFEGKLEGRISVQGHGRSVHEVAATGNGALTAVLPEGTVRATLAELTGVDLTRSLGLMLAHKKDADTTVRCGVASFKAHDGKLISQDLVVDTEPVLITGEGTIDLDSEQLALRLRGEPKHFRLVHVRSPVSIRGTLEHPAFALERGKSLAQAGGAVALGAALTPLAAILPFVDPGLAKNA